jgi:hypothetical protein
MPVPQDGVVEEDGRCAHGFWSVANIRAPSFPNVGKRSPFLVITQANEGHEVDGRGTVFNRHT